MSEQVAVAEKPLIGEIVSLTRFPVEEKSYQVAQRGVETLLKEVFSLPEGQAPRVDKKFVDQLIDDLDARLSKQVDEILHHSAFKALEAPWRSLKFLVDSVDFGENIKVEMINVAKEELLEDFEDAADITETGLFKTIYTDEFGQYGGEPVGVILGNYEFTPAAADIELLDNMAGLSAMTHAPFIASVGESFFGLDDFSELPQMKQLEAVFEGPQYIKWRELRTKDDSRNVGLALPRFMLRPTYGEHLVTRSFNYEETVSTKADYLWGNAAFAYASRLADSFAAYRWCPNIIGPQSGGAVKGLPINLVEENGKMLVHGPCETVISDRKEFELAELGFIPLTLRKDSDSAVFFSSNSIQAAKKFGSDAEGQQAELNYRLGTQLPYLFIVNRLAHYVKVLQRENLGAWKSRAEMEGELNKWIRQYVADQENPSAATRAQRPLRKADVHVTEVPGEAGWYQVALSVTPHFKFMGASFTLSLSSLLEKGE